MEAPDLHAPACSLCAAPSPHDHGPCQVCVWYTLHRPGSAAFLRQPTCLHRTMREVHQDHHGAYTVWGDITVRNGVQTCPTFQRHRPGRRARG